jgi:hypothetical protein
VKRNEQIPANGKMRKNAGRKNAGGFCQPIQLHGFVGEGYPHDDGADDDLHGGSGLDWYFAHISGKKEDNLDGRKGGEIVTAIGPFADAPGNGLPSRSEAILSDTESFTISTPKPHYFPGHSFTELL